jgi:hypothetical protein
MRPSLRVERPVALAGALEQHGLDGAEITEEALAGTETGDAPRLGLGEKPLEGHAQPAGGAIQGEELGG